MIEELIVSDLSQRIHTDVIQIRRGIMTAKKNYATKLIVLVILYSLFSPLGIFADETRPCPKKWTSDIPFSEPLFEVVFMGGRVTQAYSFSNQGKVIKGR